MKRLSICWIIGCLLELVACRPEVPTQAEQGETDVFPDYREVTVPVNMAPPNFKLVDQQLQGIIRLKTMNGELIMVFSTCRKRIGRSYRRTHKENK